MARSLASQDARRLDFSFQPSLEQESLMVLAELQSSIAPKRRSSHACQARGKTHLSLALASKRSKRRSVYFASLADIIATLAKAEREGCCARENPLLCGSPCSSRRDRLPCRSLRAAATCSSSSSRALREGRPDRSPRTAALPNGRDLRRPCCRPQRCSIALSPRRRISDRGFKRSPPRSRRSVASNTFGQKPKSNQRRSRRSLAPPGRPPKNARADHVQG